MSIYTNETPGPHVAVAETQHANALYPNFNFGSNAMGSDGFYSDCDWLWDTSFLYSAAATAATAAPPQNQLSSQRSPTNTASTNTSSTSTGASLSASSWSWDDSFLTPERATASGSSRASASVSGHSTRSSRRIGVEKRKRVEDSEVGGQENRPPSSSSRVKQQQQMNTAGPSHTQPPPSAPRHQHHQHQPQPAHRPFHAPQKYVSLSTQYVYATPNRRKILSRVSVTDYRGNICIDAYVRPSSEVVDLRTSTTGLMAEHLNPCRALDFRSVREQVSSLIKNKIIVGHSLWKDLALLSLTHPAVDTRDVALYLPFHRGIRSHGIAPLKNLVWHFMMRNIARGHEHPLEEARAALDLFRSYEDVWETDVAKKGWPCALPPAAFQQYFS